jgi:hypothetical protein
LSAIDTGGNRALYNAFCGVVSGFNVDDIIHFIAPIHAGKDSCASLNRDAQTLGDVFLDGFRSGGDPSFEVGGFFKNGNLDRHRELPQLISIILFPESGFTLPQRAGAVKRLAHFINNSSDRKAGEMAELTPKTCGGRGGFRGRDFKR